MCPPFFPPIGLLEAHGGRHVGEYPLGGGYTPPDQGKIVLLLWGGYPPQLKFSVLLLHWGGISPPRPGKIGVLHATFRYGRPVGRLGLAVEIVSIAHGPVPHRIWAPGAAATYPSHHLEHW